MNKKITTGVVLLVTAGLLATVIFGSKSRVEPAVDTLYWGITCPHCHDTIDWIEENKITDKVEIVLKEVYQDRQNAQELTARAASCGLDERNIGVPLLYTPDGRCLIGTPAITGYLSEKL